jgi:glycerophosphoryl diester phosphodiesterase
LPLSNVAHRGYSAVAPENTLPALAAGVLAGASIIEFDVRTTADGVPVVIHDRRVDRTTTGSGAVWDLTWAQIAALDAGSWFSPAYAGTRVPLLAEVLDLLRPATAGLLLEIKPPATADQVRAILAMVSERGLLERTVVQSFDPAVVALVAEVVPDVRRGLLRFAFDPDQLTLAKELGLSFCNPQASDALAEPETIARLAEAGVGVMPWTPNQPLLWPELAAAGVAGLITDHPGAVAGYLERLTGGVG